jgi:hypothetical protein
MWLLCCVVYPFCWWLALLLFAGYRLLLDWPFLLDCCWLWLVLGLAAVLALRQGDHSYVHGLSQVAHSAASDVSERCLLLVRGGGVLVGLLVWLLGGQRSGETTEGVH